MCVSALTARIMGAQRMHRGMSERPRLPSSYRARRYLEHLAAARAALAPKPKSSDNSSDELGARLPAGTRRPLDPHPAASTRPGEGATEADEMSDTDHEPHDPDDTGEPIADHGINTDADKGDDDTARGRAAE